MGKRGEKYALSAGEEQPIGLLPVDQVVVIGNRLDVRKQETSNRSTCERMAQDVVHSPEMGRQAVKADLRL